ncbi:uncharacterized protein LOC110842426 [Folsomia candida]|uniref:PR domain zinc finger protein 5 n=1 Tax=Folsomia candida TaxID=158441 RepID=A0A226F6C6_FOLCA|nr:uncharacterized protein LOC110842426 [Folsomia candida]OXA65004.1 PR domain zinc finger protein 5 [Folsomia candida]
MDNALKNNNRAGGELKCSLCDRKYKSVGTLKVHMRRSHENRGKFVCNMCNNKFDSKFVLTQHMKTNKCVSSQQENSKAKRKIKCKFCTATFEKQNALTLHLRREHYDAVYKIKCPECDKKFPNHAGLTTHKNNYHSGRENLHCPYCPFESLIKSNLKRHVDETHSEDTTKKAEVKTAQLSPAEISLENYRRYKANPGDKVVPSVIIKSEYYLKLTKQQFQKLEPDRLKTPVVFDEVNGPRHKAGWGYKSEDKTSDISYVPLTETEQVTSKKIFGYIWRDGVTFEIVEVYFGLNEEDSKIATKNKWKILVRYKNKGCTDRILFKKGYFFDSEEAFEVPGMVATSKWAAGQLKSFTRNETGSICSIKPKECYVWLSKYLEQLRAALRSVNDHWLGPVVTFQLDDKEELILARRDLEKVRGEMCEMDIGFTDKLSILTAENSNLTVENSNLTEENCKLQLRLKSWKKKQQDAKNANRLLLVQRGRQSSNEDVPCFFPVTFKMEEDGNLDQGTEPNFDIFRKESVQDEESSSDDDDDGVEYNRVPTVSDLIKVVTKVLDRSESSTETNPNGANPNQETDPCDEKTERNRKVFVVKLCD